MRYPISSSLSVTPLHESEVAGRVLLPCFTDPAVAVKLPGTPGGLWSRRTLSAYVGDVLPVASLNCTRTSWSPSEAISAQGNVMDALHGEPEQNEPAST